MPRLRRPESPLISLVVRSIPESLCAGLLVTKADLVLLLLPAVFDNDPVNEREKLDLAEAEARGELVSARMVQAGRLTGAI